MQATERNDGTGAAHRVMSGEAITAFGDNVDIEAQLKRYIAAFRVRNLHECLLRLRLKTTGVKQQLVERLTEYLNGELRAGRLHAYCPVAATVVAVYQDMKGMSLQEHLYRTNDAVRSVRCVCGIGSFNAVEYKTISCTTPQCSIQEHIYCLFPSKKFPEWSKDAHRCVRCRSYFADPFWRSAKADDLIPPTVIPEIPERPFFNQSTPAGMKFMVREFSLAQADLVYIRSCDIKIQIVCLQLDDPVQFRYHWPLNCKLAVNGKDFRVYSRHADNKVTDGQRDEPADISKLVVYGKNTIEISCQDIHPFAISVQYIAPVDRDAVLKFMHQPENLEASIMRMRRIVRGQVSNDADDEVQTMTSTMSLKCPFSFRRIVNPGRLLNIDSMECIFDLDAFLSMALRTRKWACPHSLRQSSVHHLVKDVWLEAVLKCLRKLPEIEEIEVSKEGTWRLRGENRWRSVYNTATIESLPESVAVNLPKPVDDLTDAESEDEAEELRKAVIAAKSEVKKHYQENARSTSLEVVDLVSSDEDVERYKQRPPGEHHHPMESRVLSLSGSVPEPSGRNIRPLPTAYSMEEQPLMFHQTTRVLARPSGWIRSDGNAIPLPPALGTSCPPNTSPSYPSPRFLQRRHMVHPPADKNSNIVVTKRAISIPPDSIPRPAKRQPEWTEARSGFRKTERKTRHRSSRNCESSFSSNMECIEIDSE